MNIHLQIDKPRKRTNHYDKLLAINFKKPLYIGITLLFLLIGVELEYLQFPNSNTSVVYIPFIIMVGLICRHYLSILIFTGLPTFLLLIHSNPIGQLKPLFLLWSSQLLIAAVVKTLIGYAHKERDSLITLTSILAESLDARDEYTAFHSQNVAYYAWEIGKAMKLSPKKCMNLYVGGLLHDIGKIGIPEAILNKPSRLTIEEFEIIKEHPLKGYNIIKNVPHFQKSGVLDMVLYHHERVDGMGYPCGLKGDNIPLYARIMAIADTFDAMTSRRVYRSTNDLEYAIDEIQKGKGEQFDPEIAEVFLKLMKKGNITVRGFNQHSPKKAIKKIG